MSLSSSFLFKKSLSTTPVEISLEDIRHSLESAITIQGFATIDSQVYVDHVQYLFKKVSCLKDYEKQERLEKEEVEYELQRTTDFHQEKIQELKEKNRRYKRRIADLEQQQQLSSKRQRVATLMTSDGSIGGIQISDSDF